MMAYHARWCLFCRKWLGHGVPRDTVSRTGFVIEGLKSASKAV